MLYRTLTAVAAFSIAAFLFSVSLEVALAGSDDALNEALFDVPNTPAHVSSYDMAADLGRNIRIAIKEKGIEPRFVDIVSGTSVNWINDAEYDARVTFMDGAVAITCEAPRGFVSSQSGISHSKMLQAGAVASICFLEPQDYDYVVEFFDNLEDSKVVLFAYRGAIRVN